MKMPKSTFDTEQEANDYKREHQLFQRVAVPLIGRGKWALIFPIEAHITVNDGAPDGMREPSGNLEIFIGASLRINVPEFFKDAEFIDWLNNGARKFTWHETGHHPEEWSDVIVMVDPGFTGEGSDSDMPAHIWSQIVEICRAKLGGSVASRDEHITVRLTNIAH